MVDQMVVTLATGTLSECVRVSERRKANSVTKPTITNLFCGLPARLIRRSIGWLHNKFFVREQE